ncbi:hypothetical protein A0H81_13929 [Grifola frondosa]|uniref:CCHC-type domain-containing protein n=1 Tax=Grifola frondosa TaxID=5627 RepID=A0A1C7LQ33_GRIFR|nr:hypothetical protein A0H81_13929 [Grifola frondosa]
MDAEAVTVRLTTMKCDPALLGTYDTSGLEEVPYHIAWAREICRVAMLHDAPDSMVVTIHSALPRPLKRHSGNPKTWHELLTNVEGVPMTTLVDDVNDWKAINELRHNNDATVAALQRNATLENSVASLQHSMQSLQLNRSPAPSALPVNRFPFSGNQPIPAGRGIPQSARAPSMNPATLTQPPALPILPAPDAVARLTALRTNILVHHPDSEPGHIAYKTQITEWTQKNPNATPDETKPYPLTPGTAPVGSRECHRCGITGHHGYACSSIAPVPPLETRWRRVAGEIHRDASPRRPPNPRPTDVRFMDTQWTGQPVYVAYQAPPSWSTEAGGYIEEWQQGNE